MEFTRKSEYELHPAGEFRAQFVEWKEETSDKFGTQVRMSFHTEALDSKGKNHEISVWGKPSLHPKSMVAKLLRALGTDPDSIPDEALKNFSLDNWCGQKLRLAIEHYIPQTGGDEKAKVASFLPYEAANVARDPKWDEPN